MGEEADMTNRVNEVVVLGSGTSTGIPILGCHCPVCTHNDPKNNRLRSSIFFKTAKGQHLLVDAGPDLRTQLLREKIERVDGMILTHDHADHAHGIDDLRPLSFRAEQGIPVYADRNTCTRMTEKFSYIFKRKKKYSLPGPYSGGGIAQLNLVEIPELPVASPSTILAPSMIIGSDTFHFFLNPHGPMQTLSFVHDKMAYIIDCQEIHPQILKQLREMQLELLIIDCVRLASHATHLHLDKALEYMEAINAKFCGLTHLGHDFEHNALTQQLQREYSGRVAPLYDGLALSYGVSFRR